MMNKVIKGIISAAAAVTMICGVGTATTYQKGIFSETAIVADAACVPVITGCFNGNNWSGCTKVCLSDNRKNAKIKVCAFRQDGRIKSGKFKVRVYGGDWRSQNNYVGTYNVTGSGNISLKSGYSFYKVQFIRNNGRNSADNISKTQYWSIDGTTNVSWFG